jgi:hypothetical protein
MRLAFAEPAGTGSWTLPYAEDFQADFESDYCYDRFWTDRPVEEAADTKWRAELTTRYLIAGHAFAMVVKTSGWNATNTASGFWAHFRHHYFQLGLLAHAQQASLLVFSDRLAEAVKESTVYGQRIKQIAKEFAVFLDRFWVGEVTNQVQGLELFELWRKHLRSDKLFMQVKGEIEFVHQYLAGERQEELAVETKRLTQVAGIGLMASLVAGIMGMNTFAARGEEGWPATWWMTILVFAGVLAISAALWTRIKRSKDDSSD